MPKVDYQLVMQKQSKSIRAYGALCLVFLGIIGAYSYFKWADYRLYDKAVEVNEVTIDTLKRSSLAEKSAYVADKVYFDDLNDEIDASLKEVFPSSDNYTELTRAFDSFEQQLHRSKNPFVISNIEYQQMQEDPDGEYKYLPLRMTISASRENFTKFMQYIEKSGSLLGKVRLMDIQSINLSFNEGDSIESESINFSVKINAYFQST